MHASQIHPKLTAVFNELDDADIVWCLLRGEDSPLALGGDVDLLVAASDFSLIHALVERMGFARIPAWGHGSHAFFLTYEPATDVWIKLDVVTELAFGPGFVLPTHTESECLARRERAAGVPVLCDQDAAWALLLHRLIDERASIRSIDPGRLADLASRAAGDGPLARFVDSVSPSAWSSTRIIEQARLGNSEALADLGQQLTASWRRQRRREVRRREFVNRMWRWSGKWLALRWRRGLGVALLGLDGAGKSTLASGIEQTFYFPSRSVYMGLHQQPSRQGATIPGLGLAARLSTQWTRWLRAAYHQRRGRLVLFDRYTHDARIPGRAGRSLRTRAYRWLLAHACPPPDLSLLLDTPSEMLLRRKPGHELPVLERERHAWGELVPRLRGGVVIDASRDAEALRREATAIIWRGYARRWKTWTGREHRVREKDRRKPIRGEG